MPSRLMVLPTGPVGNVAVPMRWPPLFAPRHGISRRVSFYGTWLVSDAEESPHPTLHQGNVELYIACAEFDELAPVDMALELQQLLNASGAEGELEIYPNVEQV